MTKEELGTIIKGIVEEHTGTVSDSISKEIEDKLTLKFAELAKGFVRKPIGDETTDGIDTTPKFKSFGEQLQAVIKAGNGVQDARLKASGMNEAIPSEAGFVVQSDFSNELITTTHDVGILYKKCRKMPIGPGSNSITLNGIDETSRVNGSRWGGVQIYWSDEAGTVTATKPKFRQMNLKLKKLMGLAYATEELLQDAVALQSWVSQAFTEEMAFKIDDGIVNGAGVGQLLGILNSPSLVSQAAEAGQVAATVVFENIINMWNRMPARNRTKAEWYLNQDVEPQLMQMFLSAGVGGVPVYIPANGVVGGPQGGLMGRPTVPIEQCSALGTIGDIIFADLNEYLIIDKGTMEAAESIHVKFIYGEDTFRFTYRVDGQPLWSNTLTAFKGSTTRSPFVALATRS
jgi:HK97 family phage major capsid protein